MSANKFAVITFESNKDSAIVPISWVQELNEKKINKNQFYYCFYSTNTSTKSPQFERALYCRSGDPTHGFYKVAVKQIFRK
jgi:hypothetical protein